MPEVDAGLLILPYDREKAVAYAHRWAFARNPAYYDFSALGGDCTNYASQCVYAGTGIMNYKPVYGWYYVNAGNRTPSWTGVEYFYNFMVNNTGVGPFMRVVELRDILPGDIIQIKFGRAYYEHNPVVVSVGAVPEPSNILVAAHTYDADYRPLDTYPYTALRPMHVLGARRYRS
ncbi:MAG: amidase domain-containing protein [Bacillota bacterium]